MYKTYKGFDVDQSQSVIGVFSKVENDLYTHHALFSSRKSIRSTLFVLLLLTGEATANVIWEKQSSSIVSVHIMSKWYFAFPIGPKPLKFLVLPLHWVIS